MNKVEVQVPREAVDAFQRGDLVAVFKSLRQAAGINAQEVRRALEAQARQQHAARGDGTKPPLAAATGTLDALADKARVTQHGIARQVALHRKRPPTVEMGDAPGSLRWMLLVLALLAAAIWIVAGS